jgi:hypothetical protein
MEWTCKDCCPLLSGMSKNNGGFDCQSRTTVLSRETEKRLRRGRKSDKDGLGDGRRERGDGRRETGDFETERP